MKVFLSTPNLRYDARRYTGNVNSELTRSITWIQNLLIHMCDPCHTFGMQSLIAITKGHTTILYICGMMTDLVITASILIKICLITLIAERPHQL